MDDAKVVTFHPLQLSTLKMALETELRSGVGGMQLTREPALSIYKRLVADQLGLKVGRGLKGRQDALEVVQEILNEYFKG
jgi:hypothetical protein